MKRRQVRSSMMTSVGYDAEHATLEVEFRTGHIYDYFVVPKSVYQALIESESKGQFFHTRIEGKFRAVRVDEPT